jgi:diaminopimelate epimerase
MYFIKFHGFGNDYIVFEADQLAHIEDKGTFSKRICDRHYGAGADGITVVKKSDDGDSDFTVKIYNPDGSEAGMSGNGTRCTAAYLHYKNLWDEEILRLNTKTGIKIYRLLEKISDGHYWYESELGKPGLDSASIPMITDNPKEIVTDYPLTIEGEQFKVTSLLMGNPNTVIYVDDFDTIDWRRIGRALEVHPAYPDRTNVIFARIADRANIEIRLWERGVGETFSSGTCSCAAAVASMVNGKTDRRVAVHAPGGKIDVIWREDGEVVMTGRADIVFSGEWLGE